MERLVASRALVKATTAKAKKAMRKRQLLPLLFGFPGGIEGIACWMLTRSAGGMDHRERVCENRFCNFWSAVAKESGLRGRVGGGGGS